MDPCPFVRLVVGNLALRIPTTAKPAGSGVHPSSSPCFCKIRLSHHHFPHHTAVVPLLSPDSPPDSPHHQTLAASFHLSHSDLLKLTSQSKSLFASHKPSLKLSLYSGRRGTTCGVNAGRLLGKLVLPLDLEGTQTRPCVFQNGWVSIGKDKVKKNNKEELQSMQIHLCVRAEPDPRFVFQFEGEPECSPQVFQIQGSIRQPVFTCKFSFRTPSADRNIRPRSSQVEPSGSRGWLSSLGSERERPGKERKGWSITVHDINGSPVATASMVTPFVASAGSDRVSRSNPGAWLIMRPGEGTWKPWGRLEAWRERGSSDGLGYRFELLVDTNGGMSSAGIVLADSIMPSHKGGQFSIDITAQNGTNNSPGCSPRGSGDFGCGLWPYALYRGFVMSSTVEGEGKCSTPEVVVSARHVNCTEDAAAFVALAAAVDLSMDACRLFSHKLRKELCQQQDLFGYSN